MVNIMQTEFDNKLKTLFAQSDAAPINDSFVAKTVKRIRALQRRDTIFQYSGIALLLLLLIFFSADIISAVNWASIKIGGLLTDATSNFMNMVSSFSEISIQDKQQAGVTSVQGIIAYIIAGAVVAIAMMTLLVSGTFRSRGVKN